MMYCNNSGVISSSIEMLQDGKRLFRRVVIQQESFYSIYDDYYTACSFITFPSGLVICKDWAQNSSPPEFYYSLTCSYLFDSQFQETIFVIPNSEQSTLIFETSITLCPTPNCVEQYSFQATFLNSTKISPGDCFIPPPLNCIAK